VAILLLLALVLRIFDAPSLLLVGVAVAGWCSVVALLGFVRARNPDASPLVQALADSALPVYLLHQPVIVFLGFGIVQLPLGLWTKFVLLLITSGSATLMLYAVARRFSTTRFLLGMRPLAPSSHRIRTVPVSASAAQA
jgi:peptidoglycan/LPS O-acetylase OafA/YrhL